MQAHQAPKDRDALYYPYIHIRDPEWLKATLLIFPHLVRMVPTNFAPRDQSEIYEYLREDGRRGALIRRARMDTPGVVGAQEALRHRIEKDLARNRRAFVRKFGRTAAAAVRRSSSFGFQMHANKAAPEFMEWLIDQKLAWIPEDPEFLGYVEVHPTLGSAIMSTLAIACAQDEGLEIVADPSEGRLHRCLVEQRVEGVYDDLLKGEAAAGSKPVEPSGEGLLEVIVFQYADVSRVTPSALAELNKEWEALGALRAALQELAGYVPAAANPDRLKEYLRDKAADALRKWESDKANMKSFKRAFLGDGAFKPGEEFMKKITEKTLSTEGVTIAAPALVGGLTTGSFLIAGLGLGIGLIFHALSSWRKAELAEKNSPYRYLTMMEKAGVVFTLSSQRMLSI